MPIINRHPVYVCDFCSVHFDPETITCLRTVNSIVIGANSKSYIADCICGKCQQSIIEAVRKINDHSMSYMAGLREV